MNKRDLVIEEVRQVPEPFLGEILDFIRSVIAGKTGKRHETAFASESSLGKDWLKPEEDAAWKDL